MSDSKAGSDEEIEAPSVDDSGAEPESVWKDELNLAEFPIAALSDRIPDGQLTLTFEDRLERRGSEPIIRRLTVMATPKYGLPTSLDDEVLVGLIQLTKRRSNFSASRVAFSRYELIELLGWPQNGQSYLRIEESLNRWVGVVLMYENAWWDNAAKSWVDESFHVLDNVTLYDRERRRRGSRKGAALAEAKGKAKAESEPLPLSSFRWNDVIFQSFQSGNLKQLDLEFYLSLKLPTTKRMFRFLDKRFYRRTRLEFDLRVLACEHIGLSRKYPPTELKRRLKPALDELEQLGFLEPLGEGERYLSIARGQWRILLVRGRLGRTEKQSQEIDTGLIHALTERGVARSTSEELVEVFKPSRIRAKVEVFDWLVKNKDKRVGKNASGYLVASIRSDYQAPEDFRADGPRRTSAPFRPSAEAKEKPACAVTPSHEPVSGEDAAHQSERFKDLWESLPQPERDAIAEAVRAANPGLGRFSWMLNHLCIAELEQRHLRANAETRAQGG